MLDSEDSKSQAERSTMDVGALLFTPLCWRAQANCGSASKCRQGEGRRNCNRGGVDGFAKIEGGVVSRGVLAYIPEPPSAAAQVRRSRGSVAARSKAFGSQITS